VYSASLHVAVPPTSCHWVSRVESPQCV